MPGGDKALEQLRIQQLGAAAEAERFLQEPHEVLARLEDRVALADGDHGGAEPRHLRESADHALERSLRAVTRVRRPVGHLGVLHQHGSKLMNPLKVFHGSFAGPGCSTGKPPSQ